MRLRTWQGFLHIVFPRKIYLRFHLYQKIDYEKASCGCRYEQLALLIEMANAI